MKHFYKHFLVSAVFAFTTANAQTTITEWNFTADVATPNVGTGTITLIGGTTNTFASGSGSSDPDTTTNRAYNTSTYAALGTENKQRGIQVSVSTVGYQGISLVFDQRLSNTANNTYVVQYTTNGTDWTDAQTFTFAPAATGTGDMWYNQRAVNLSSISAMNNNANAAFRIVSAFDPTSGNYLAARSTSTYGTSGTVRYDNVKVIAQSTLSIQTFEKNPIKMYPNPVANGQKLYFEEATTGNVLDLNGRNLQTFSNATEISINNYNSGVYFVKTNDGKINKFLIN